MDDVRKKTDGTGSGEYTVRRRRRRRFSNVRSNLFWCGIILLITLILGAVIGFYSNYFDRYFKSEEEKTAVTDQQMAKKLRDLYMDKLLREKERSRR